MWQLWALLLAAPVFAVETHADAAAAATLLRRGDTLPQSTTDAKIKVIAGRPNSALQMEVEASGGVNAEANLHADRHESSKDRGALTGPREVMFGIFCRRVYDVDVIKKTWTGDIVLTTSWNDPEVAQVLPVGKEDTRYSTDDARKLIWLPDIGVTNRDFKNVEIISSSVKIWSSGWATKVERMLVTMTNDFDTSAFPFDKQTLQVIVASEKLMADELVLKPHSDKTLIGVKDDVLTGTGFGGSGGAKPDYGISSFKETDALLVKSRGLFQIHIVRGFGAAARQIFGPTMTLLLVSYSVFYFPMVPAFTMPRVASSVISLLGEMTLLTKTKVPDSWTDVYNEMVCLLIGSVSVLSLTMEITFHSYKNEELAKKLAFAYRVLYPVVFLVLFTIVLCFSSGAFNDVCAYLVRTIVCLLLVANFVWVRRSLASDGKTEEPADKTEGKCVFAYIAALLNKFYHDTSQLVEALVTRSARAECFDNGIAPERLANLVDQDGAVYPLGIAVGDWPAARLLSAVAAILIEELLGVNVSARMVGGNSVDGFYAMAGCKTPDQVADRGCGPKTTRMHLHLEAWVRLYQIEFDQILKDYPDTAPKSLGSSGYTGAMSMYLQERTLNTALNGEGIPLDFYRAYNASWYEPWQYFDGVSAVSRAQMLPCRETRFVQSRNMQAYVEVTSDTGGVEDNSGSLMARCQDGFFWQSPACRDNVARCVLVLTGGSGYAVEEIMQKATAFNMPLAVGVATAAEYPRLPSQVQSLFMWWVPDDTFLDLSPREVRFPRYNREAWLGRDLRSAPEQLAIEKLVSPNLAELAPAVVALVQKLRWSVDDVNLMMMDMKTSEDPANAVACRWLKANSEKWSSWLAGDTACFPGFGLFDPSRGYVAEREGSTELGCRPCESGSYSQEMQDAKGTTHICQKCSPGTSQSSGAASGCDPCSQGEYQDEEGAVDCMRCPVGRFQDEQGATECKICENGTTTLGLGSWSEEDCGCLPGTISKGDNRSCQLCPEGLSCPVLSTLSSLLNGSSIAHELTPQIRAGYYSTWEQPLELFKCVPASHCPGGPPNTCTGGLTTLPCAACREREYFDGQVCIVCVSSRQELLFGGFCIAVCGLVLAYYLLNSPMTAKASVMLTGTTALGMMVMTLQKVGVIGNLTVAFPRQIRDTFRTLQVFILDLETLGFPCVATPDSVRRYLGTVMLFPAGVVGILVCLALSKLLPKKWRWATSKSLNLIGQFLSVGYTTMSVTAMVPMTCYSHPNGRHSLLKYPDVFCGTTEHSAMLGAGIGLLAGGVVGFLGLCIWAALQVPLWSSQGHSDKVGAFRFLLARFRLDGWWYGVPLLVRGSLLNLPVVLATDYPPVQTLGSPRHI
ncbi:glvI [Symbiodinium pilosum]|uniref:GlvI protein n=1 Tax=Symbiodinium pilosum TaxID=2952 RepID=A0A812PTS3_SYMPI|nr:glvI [Symbiodinium pilosum]